jgi:succinate dehydrogenase/fumarate reductase flavoprotein subunit
MIYPPEVLESMQRVHATRQARLGQSFPRMTPEQRQEILKKFHPDYIENAFRPLKVGPNKGSQTLHELAAALEARARIGPGEIDLSAPAVECDVLVIGGGGAGASAALLAQESGACTCMVTKLRFGDANTMMAQGGIQAADKANDSPGRHYLDVIGGGGYSNDPELVEALVLDAPGVIAWLEGLGCMFDKEPDGTMRTIHGGGTSRKRMHAARDYTGAEIMRTLRDEVHNRPDISLIEFSPAIELVLDEAGRIAGAVVQNLETQALAYIRAKAVILATGGSGRLHYQGFPTTNHYGATGDGLVLAYRVGAPLSFIDTMQYHPTGSAFPEQILGQLVTEKVRGLGAQVCNVDGEQFVYPLETRDVEAAAFIRECRERGKGVVTPTAQPCVWLDSPLIDVIHGPGTIARGLPAMVRQYKRFGIDMTVDPILVYPTLHYQNGGVAIKPDASTPVPGLYVAGEAAGGIHGRNRLMGNSLLDIVVFGRRAGRAAGEYVKDAQLGAPTLAHLEAWSKELEAAGAPLRNGVLDGQISPVLLPHYTRDVA